MKKFLLAIVVVSILFWVGTLALIPNPLIVASAGYIKASSAKVNSFALDTANWHKWWPVRSAESYSYSVVSRTAFGARLLASNGSDTFTSELLVLPATQDSAIVQWTTVQPASSNPFTRIKQYNRAAGIKQHLQLLLDSLAAYMNNRKKIYGLNIAITNFTNPFMLNTQARFNHYPTTDEVYQTIRKIRAYTAAGGAVAVDSPMVNIEQTNNTYLLRAAVPVNKKLDAANDISFKQMVLGKTLLSSVTGGPQQVAQSLASMQDFINDYRLSSPAIPFQVWQTNRQQQTDSSRWITRLYYPIF